MNTPVQLITGPLTGAACLLHGLNRLRQPGLRRFVWGPLLINLGLYVLGIWSGMHYFSAALDWLMPGLAGMAALAVVAIVRIAIGRRRFF